MMLINAPYSVKIYGSKNTHATDSNSECLKSVLDADTDASSVTVYTYTINKQNTLEQDEYSGDNQIVINNSLSRTYFEFNLNEYRIEYDESDYNTLSAVIAKRHHYIQIISNPYGIALHSVNNLIAVVPTGFETSIESGIKLVRISYKKRKNS